MVLALCFAACGKTPQAGETQATLPIAFSASMTESKASGEISGVDDLRANGFGVFACYTGLNRYAESSVTADFMHNQEVTWDSEHEVWSYAPLKYWPNGEGELGEWGTASGKHYVSFFAYAPYSDADSENPESHPEGYCISSFCHPQEATDPWLLYRIHPNPEKQVDLLYAKPLLDQFNLGIDNKLSFSFRHALANVGETVTVSCSDELKAKVGEGVGTLFDEAQLILTHVSLKGTFTEKARLILWNKGQANWGAVLSENTMITTEPMEVFSGEHVLYTSSSASSTPWSETGKGLFYIPLEVNDNTQYATVSLRYKTRRIKDGVVTDTEREGEVSLSLKDYSLEGKTLNINISLNTL